MLLRRITQHVKAQNWFAVGLDFLIVVVGVFIGIQVSNWNAARVDQDRALGYLERINANLDADIKDIEIRTEFWRKVADYGATGLAYAETSDASTNSAWEMVLAYFQASQVAELIPSQATYDELKSAGELGLITNHEIRNALTNYYLFTAAPSVTERPPYREHVRGIIPLNVQQYIWNSCYVSDGTGDQDMRACPSPISGARATEIADAISSDTALMRELRYWMSSMHVAGIIGQSRLDIATALRVMINEEISKS